MSFAPVALSLIGTGLSVYGQLQQGRAAADAGRAQQAAAYAEAESLEQRAGQERAVGQRTAERVRQAGERVKARQRAVSAASGFASDDVGSQAIARGTEKEISMQELLALAQAEDEARVTEHQAALRRRGGDISRMQGEYGKRASRIGAATTLVTGAANAWNMWPRGGGG